MDGLFLVIFIALIMIAISCLIAVVAILIVQGFNKSNDNNHLSSNQEKVVIQITPEDINSDNHHDGFLKNTDNAENPNMDVSQEKKITFNTLENNMNLKMNESESLENSPEQERLIIRQDEISPKSEDFIPLMNKIDKARQEISKQVFGMENMIDQCFIALLSGGHVLCEGLPGLAKTTLAKAFSKIISCSFKRCQFSPDLLPSDLIGDRIFNQKTGNFDFKSGPVFTQILLADEINRAPAKTQAALLEVMQEAQVTVFGEQHLIGIVDGVDKNNQGNRIFFTIATQNPIEQEGTYRLPEAQLDRFMFRLFFQWPERNAELEILNLENGFVPPAIEPCFTAAEIIEWKEKIARDVQASNEIKEQIVDLMRMTRKHKDILVGAGPRASQVLLRGAKVRAAMNGRDFVKDIDVQAVAFDALNHRIQLKPDVMFDNPDSNPLDLLKAMLNETLFSLQKQI